MENKRLSLGPRKLFFRGDALPSDRSKLASRIVRHLRPMERTPSNVNPITGRSNKRTGINRIKFPWRFVQVALPCTPITMTA